MMMNGKTSGGYIPGHNVAEQQTSAQESNDGLVHHNSEQGLSSTATTGSSECDKDTKKKRNYFSCFQKVELERIFFYNAYPTRRTCQYLADQFGTSFYSVKIWFKNRRARRKKDLNQYSGYPRKGFHIDRQLPLQNTSQANYPSFNGLGESPWQQQNQQSQCSLHQSFDSIDGITNDYRSVVLTYHKTNY